MIMIEKISNIQQPIEFSMREINTPRLSYSDEAQPFNFEGVYTLKREEYMRIHDQETEWFATKSE